MKVTTNEVLEVVYDCIDDLNSMLPSGAKLTKTADTILVGDNGVLDSLSLINLLVSIEEGLKTKLDLQCFLLDESLLVDPDGPYKSIGRLSEWVISGNK